jgi:hypothetical protein
VLCGLLPSQVDLAGSERTERSGATGERMKEACAINKSLSCLSDVFHAISNNQKHIPYRNSKLTHLLAPCLGGDGKTLMFVNVSPEAASAEETLCSLRFASQVNSCELGNRGGGGGVKRNVQSIAPGAAKVGLVWYRASPHIHAHVRSRRCRPRVIRPLPIRPSNPHAFASTDGRPGGATLPQAEDSAKASKPSSARSDKASKKESKESKVGSSKEPGAPLPDGTCPLHRDVIGGCMQTAASLSLSLPLFRVTLSQDPRRPSAPRRTRTRRGRRTL